MASPKTPALLNLAAVSAIFANQEQRAEANKPKDCGAKNSQKRRQKRPATSTTNPSKVTRRTSAYTSKSRSCDGVTSPPPTSDDDSQQQERNNNRKTVAVKRKRNPKKKPAVAPRPKSGCTMKRAMVEEMKVEKSGSSKERGVRLKPGAEKKPRRPSTKKPGVNRHRRRRRDAQQVVLEPQEDSTAAAAAAARRASKKQRTRATRVRNSPQGATTPFFYPAVGRHAPEMMMMMPPTNLMMPYYYLPWQPPPVPWIPPGCCATTHVVPPTTMQQQHPFLNPFWMQQQPLQQFAAAAAPSYPPVDGASGADRPHATKNRTATGGGHGGNRMPQPANETTQSEHDEPAAMVELEESPVARPSSSVLGNYSRKQDGSSSSDSDCNYCGEDAARGDPHDDDNNSFTVITTGYSEAVWT